VSFPAGGFALQQAAVARVGAICACIIVLAGCADAARAVDPPASTTAPAVTVPAPATTTTIDRAPPARVGGLRIAEVKARMFAPPAQWLRIDRPDHITQYAAVYRPQRPGRYPVVVYLHGSSGLGVTELAWSQKLAERGFVVVTGCYLDPYPSPRLLACPGVQRQEPLVPEQDTLEYKALVDVASALPDAKPDALGVVGVSWGAIMALSLREPRVKAIVADSGYGRNGAATVTAPVLMLGREEDAHVSHLNVLAFDAVMRKAHKRITAHYYPGIGHVATLDLPPVAMDATNRTETFLRATLKN
jgi:dienelactone hydrolase